MKKRKKLLRIVFGRTTFVVLFLLIQVAVLLLGISWLEDYTLYFYGASVILSAVVLIYIISADESSTIKLSWVVPILVFPVFGVLFYLFVKLQVGTKLIGLRLQVTAAETAPYLKQDEATALRFNEISSSQGNLVKYMNRYAGVPVYADTAAKYFPLGEDMFEEMKRELRKAEHFIFMEYFIVERGEMWNSLLEILEEKVKEGVEVRVIYDDVGSIFTLPADYPGRLEKLGIQCRVFNRMVPVISLRQNNRDHRKYMIVDGRVAFTGGINMADEYINVKPRFGHWKDNAIRLEGDAVWSMTVSFLSMWDFTQKREEDLRRYRPEPAAAGAEGYVQPYHDCPWDDEPVGQSVYLHLISRAKQYVYITTPYLVIDHTVTMALSLAAKSGVDVRIITPHIPDKKTVFEVTRSYYWQLLQAGVKIYEYEPGFIHSKIFVVDDAFATVGTVNLDYRSMFPHFENGVLLYGTDTVDEIREDFLATQGRSIQVTAEACRSVPLPRKLLRVLLRVFAPLL